MANDMTTNEPGRPPEPIPVFDVTCEHIYTGGVFKQYYVFLWVSVAFVLGAILPWNGGADAGMTLLQSVFLVLGIGLVWNSVACIRSRRLTIWPMFMVEIVAIIFVFLHYDHVDDLNTFERDVRLEQIKEERNNPPADLLGNKIALMRRNERLEAEHAEVRDIYDWGLLDIVLGRFQSFRIAGDEESQKTRAKFDKAWSSFGTGFHLTWLTMAFLFFFIIGSIVHAVATTKPKEDPKEARRRARAAEREKKSPDTEAQFAMKATSRAKTEDADADETGKAGDSSA